VNINFRLLAGVVFGYALFIYIGNATYLPKDPYWIVWPANGFLFAFLTIVPVRTWPIYLAFTWAVAFCLTHFWFDMSLAFSLLVPTFDTLDPVCALLLLRKFVGEKFEFDSPKHVGMFLILSAFGPTFVSSLLGAITVNTLFGEPFLLNWQIWWFADALGYVLAGVLAFSVFHAPKAILSFDLAGTRREFIWLLITTIAVSTAIFTHNYNINSGNLFLELHMVLFAFAIWSGLRFSVLHTAFVMAVIASIGFACVLVGLGPFWFSDFNSYPVIVNTQIFFAVIAITGYLLSSYVGQSVRLNRHLVQSREEVSHRAEEALKANAELEQFAYVASHDLKAPLRAIENLSTWIEEDIAESMGDDTRQNMKLLRGRVKRMNQLLEGLLNYSRIGRKGKAVEEVDVAHLIKEVVDMSSADENFKVVVASDLPVITTREVPLQLVLRNLVENAIKHHDLDMGEIVVACHEKSGHYEFSVSDDGPGIDPDYHEKIFAMFQTLKSRDEVEGSGMGLALVKKTVDSVGGNIVVESQSGVRGTKFVFQWPHMLADET
jgi:signal transduction histidine kinase